MRRLSIRLRSWDQLNRWKWSMSTQDSSSGSWALQNRSGKRRVSVKRNPKFHMIIIFSCLEKLWYYREEAMQLCPSISTSNKQAPFHLESEVRAGGDWRPERASLCEALSVTARYHHPWSFWLWQFQASVTASSERCYGYQHGVILLTSFET
jgi:hypothetical protein